MPVIRTTIVTRNQSTFCDIMCTTVTRKELILHPPRELSKEWEATASFTYQKPESLSAYYQIPDPTPMQRMNLAKQRNKLNQEFKEERDEFFGRLKSEKNIKDRMEGQSATMIQAAWRGLALRRRRKIGRFNDLSDHPKRLPQYRTRRIPVSVQELNTELCTWQSALNLKPINGLTLESLGRNARRQERFEFAGAIRIQCFFRKFHAKLKVSRHRARKKNSDRMAATVTIAKFAMYVVSLLHRRRAAQAHYHEAAIVIQSAFRIWSARRMVRMVFRLKKSHKRENSAAVAIQRNFRMIQAKQNASTVDRGLMDTLGMVENAVLEEKQQVVAENLLSVKHAIRDEFEAEKERIWKEELEKTAADLERESLRRQKAGGGKGKPRVSTMQS